MSIFKIVQHRKIPTALKSGLYIFLIFVIVSIAVDARGQSSVLTSKIQRIELEPRFYSEQVLNLEQANQLMGKNNESEAINPENYSTRYYWYQLHLTNHTKEREFRFVTKRYLDHIVAYVPNEFGEFKLKEAGNAIPVARRELHNRRHSVSIVIEPGNTVTIVLGLSFGNPVSTAGFSIVSKDELDDEVQTELIFTGLFYGVAFVLFFYNLFFYRTLKDKTYLMYEIFVVVITFGVSLAATTFESTFNRWFGPSPGLIRLLQTFATLAAMLFVFRFLHINKFARPIRNIFWTIFLGEILVVLSYPFIPIRSLAFLSLLSPLAIMFLIFCTCIKVYAGDRSSLIYLMGLVCVATGVAIKESYHLGLLDNDLVGAWSAVAGVSFEMIFMSFAIGHRIRAKMVSLVRELEESKSSLQQKVMERTAELEDRNKLLLDEVNSHKIAKVKISEQQQLLIQSEKMSSLGLMAAGVAHEINNPLAIISGYAENIERKIERSNFEPQLIISMAQKIQETTKRITKIVKGMRIYARHGEKVPFEEVVLTDLIDYVVNISRESLEAINARIFWKNLLGEAKIMCRAEQISQVLVSLVFNSIDAISLLEEKWIQIKLEENEKYFVLEIEDSGNGIPEELAKRIFDPFFTTKEVGKGTGLGLSISKGVMSDHGGELLLNRSKKHTSFSLIFPKTGHGVQSCPVNSKVS